MVKIYPLKPHQFWILLLWLFSAVALAADIQVYTDRDTVSLNESFQLIYEAKGSVDDDPDFSVLRPYVDILNQSQSSNVSIVNGNYSSSKTWTLSVMARQPGKLRLPAVSFGSDKSAPLEIQVDKVSSVGNASEDFFTRIEVAPEQAYVQQQIIITQSLYSNKNLSAYTLGELDFNGQDVVIEPLGKEKQYKTRIGNRAFLVVEKRYAVYPQVAGQLVMNPGLAEARTSSSSSFFDPFGRSGNVVRARTEPITIKVNPVPLDANMSPWLPANDLEITESWAKNPPLFTQGEPLTRTISIKADGLTAAQLPELPELVIDGVKMYPDQPMIKDVANESGITGYRIEKIAFIPTEPGRITLPEIEIPWWDTQSQTRRVARIAERTIEVRASVVNSKQQPSKPVTQPKLELEPAPQVERPSEPADLPQDTYAQVDAGWKILTVVFAIAWLITLIGWIVTIRNKKPQAVEMDTGKPSHTDSVKTALKQLDVACQARDRKDCRSALINWAQLLFQDGNILGLSTVMQRLPDQMASEVRKIDFGLYASGSDKQVNIIDYEQIAHHAREVTRANQTVAAAQDASQLEPLHKI